MNDVNILCIDFLNLLVRAWHVPGNNSDGRAVRSMFQTVANAVRTLRPDKVVFCLDGGYDHRTAILSSYKKNRKPSDPDLIRQRELAVEAIRVAGFCAIGVVGFEADDVIATIARNNDGVVIASSDKDLLALGGMARIHHPWKDKKTGSVIGFVTAEEKLNVCPGQVTDYLSLMGDASDGVPGCPGVGPKTAAKWMDKYNDLEGVLNAARLLHIIGAVGKNLRKHTPDVLIANSLVKMVDTLQLPEVTPWTPSTAWLQRLQDLSLSGVASVLEALQKSLAEDPPSRFEPSSSGGNDYQLPDAYEAGVGCRRRFENSQQTTVNPFRRGGKYYPLWQAGYDGEPMPDAAAEPKTPVGQLSLW